MSSTESPSVTSREWSVGVLDDNAVRAAVTAGWLEEGVPCYRATEPTELLEKFDPTCTVLCIRESGGSRADLVREVWTRCPHTQVLVLLGREDFESIERTCDGTLQEPYSKRDLREAVERLFGRGLYALKLRQYYQLTTYLTAHPEGARGASEAALEAYCSDLEREIDRITDAFDGTDFQQFLRSQRERERALDSGSPDEEPVSRSKYRPDRCPECGLAWGTSHGGRLDVGYERVAALVWRCLNCGSVRKVAPGEYDRIL